MNVRFTQVFVCFPALGFCKISAGGEKGFYRPHEKMAAFYKLFR